MHVLYHHADYDGPRTSTAAVKRKGSKFLYDMLLNGEDCERDVVIMPFKRRNDFDTVG